MTDPYFRLYVSVYEINKIVHGCLEIWNLFSRVQFEVANQFKHEKINSTSPRACVLFSI